MKNSLTPSSYPDNFEYLGYHFKYKNCHEFNQGGPMVGKLLINNLAFYPGDEFGGPILFYNSYAFIPTVKRSLFGDYRFKIGVLNLKTKRFRTGGQKEWVVIPFEADDEYVYYFITVDLSKQKMFRYIE